MSHIAMKAGIAPSDDKATIAKKLKAWIASVAPDLDGPTQADQALLAWDAIFAAWGKDPGGFREAWAEHADGALARQRRRWK